MLFNVNMLKYMAGHVTHVRPKQKLKEQFLQNSFQTFLSVSNKISPVLVTRFLGKKCIGKALAKHFRESAYAITPRKKREEEKVTTRNCCKAFCVRPEFAIALMPIFWK